MKWKGQDLFMYVRCVRQKTGCSTNRASCHHWPHRPAYIKTQKQWDSSFGLLRASCGRSQIAPSKPFENTNYGPADKQKCAHTTATGSKSLFAEQSAMLQRLTGRKKINGALEVLKTWSFSWTRAVHSIILLWGCWVIIAAAPTVGCWASLIRRWR